MGNIHEHEGISAGHDLKLCFFKSDFISYTAACWISKREVCSSKTQHNSSGHCLSLLMMRAALQSKCWCLSGLFCFCLSTSFADGWVGNRALEKFPVLAFTGLTFETDQHVCSSCLTKKQINMFCCSLRVEVNDKNTRYSKIHLGLCSGI